MVRAKGSEASAKKGVSRLEGIVRDLKTAVEALEKEVKRGVEENEEDLVGQDVVMTRRDAYHGKRGEVLSRRGRVYWNIKLDDGRMIYKKRDGFRVDNC